MTIGEKLAQIAERIPFVYEAGQQSMIDESKIIEKTVSGSVIAVDDVSEVPHDVGVQLSSDTVTDFSGVAVKVFGQNIFSNVVTSSVANPLTKINSTTYSIAPDMNNGKMYGIRADVSTLPLEIGDVLKCSVKSISKIGATYGWRVEYQDGTYNGASNSLNATLTVNKPFKALLLYCDMGSAGFSYEPVVFTDVVVYKESDVTKYTANSDGSVNVKSISPYMTILTDTLGVDISATYHKSFGMQTEYDRFWDAYQNNGEAMDYSYSFAGINWDDDCYNPKYPIKCTACTNMLRNAIITDTKVPIDISNGSGTYVLANCRNLVRIPKIIVNENVIFTGWLTTCTALEEIRFEGVIGKSLDIHWSTKLSAESYENIFKCMTVTVSGQTLTVPKSTAEATYNAKYGSGKWASRVNGIKALGWAVSYL